EEVTSLGRGFALADVQARWGKLSDQLTVHVLALREQEEATFQRLYPLPPTVHNWLVAKYLSDPTPDHWRRTEEAVPEPIVFVRSDDVAEYLLNAGFQLLPNLDNWKNAGWIEDVMADLTPTDNSSDSPPHCIARLNLPLGRHRLIGIRRIVLTAPAK